MELERHWPAMVVLVGVFGMRLARYLQWRWTKEITDPEFQLRWLLNIYGQGFAYVALAMWGGVAFATSHQLFDYPRDLESIETPTK